MTTLVHTPHVRVDRFVHAAGTLHVDPERERSEAFGVNFVDRGEFAVRTDGPWSDVTVRGVFVTVPGMEFSCRHADECPQDECLSLVYSEAAVESARSFGALDGVGVLPLSNRLGYLRRALPDHAPADPAQAEAVAAAVMAALTVRPSRAPLFHSRRLSWYAARVDRAKAQMRVHHAEPLSLSVLARDAGMSLFHFARTFTELEGQPPHRFLIEVRLTRAHELLRAGASVTDACYLTGFQSLSHFVTSFRRRYGTTPSRIGGGAGS